MFFEKSENIFSGIFQAAQAAKRRAWGGNPNKIPIGQNERLAKFGTVVESCSKKLPDCRSLPTATFSENRNQLFYKRLRAGILPLTPYNTAKSKNDGLSGKNFSGGSVFPDNKAFWKLRFARCLKKAATFFGFTV